MYFSVSKTHKSLPDLSGKNNGAGQGRLRWKKGNRARELIKGVFLKNLKILCKIKKSIEKSKKKRLKGGVHISVHVRESKCFFLFLINFMALKIPLTCTSVVT